MQDIITDLEAEQNELDGLVRDLTPDQWDQVTPAEPWTIRDQISHLAYYDEKAALAATDPEAFHAELQDAVGEDLAAYFGAHIDRGRELSTTQLLDWWRETRAQMLAALAPIDPDTRLPWYGPPMRARTAAIARLMETWAHGQDVADTLGMTRPVTDRLFHIAELAIKTFKFSFENRGLDVPVTPVRVTLRGVTGNLRVWNDDSDESVTGPVEEFCQVATQRRHLDDTHLVIEGAVAERWMQVIQVFAGPPGPGRRPLSE